MATTSEDVRPTKRTKKEPTIAEKEDINLKENNAREQMARVVEEYDEVLKDISGGKVWLKMERENMSFTTDSGVRFTKDAPYQLVEADEVERLLKQNFRKAYPEEIKEFYGA